MNAGLHGPFRLPASTSRQSLLSAYSRAVVHTRRMRIVMEAIRGVVATQPGGSAVEIVAEHFDGVEGKFGLRLVMQKK